MLNAVVEPLLLDFIQQALAMSILLSISAAVLSCFLVLRGWALMGDAISHAVLPGIVLAYAAGIPVVIGAFVAGLVCSLVTGFLAENSRLKEDTAMGVVFSGMFGLGLVLFSALNIDFDLHTILFGNVLGVNWADVWQSAAIAALSVGLVVAKRKDLLVLAFDPQHAKTIGLPVALLHYGLLILLSIVIVSGLKAVGISLIIALLIAPGAIAHLLTDRFDRMLLIACTVSTVASITGVIVSFHLDSATAPTIVLVLIAFFLLAFLFAPRYGIVAGRLTSARVIAS